MFKRVLIILIAGIFILGMNKLSFAQVHSEHGHGTTEAVKEAGLSEKAVNPAPADRGGVNVGNKICPVSGEKIEEKLKSTYEYNGKVYNFCCASCVDEFKNDPEKYIKKIEQELQAESKGQ